LAEEIFALWIFISVAPSPSVPCGSCQRVRPPDFRYERSGDLGTRRDGGFLIGEITVAERPGE
jgi:hypothetical protein